MKLFRVFELIGSMAIQMDGLMGWSNVWLANGAIILDQGFFFFNIDILLKLVFSK